MMAEDPDGFGPRVASRLAADHGDDPGDGGGGWRHVLRIGGRAWLAIAESPDEDFYDHRLHELRVPALVLHGEDDPRTEPGELDRVRRAAPTAAIHVIAGGGHSPHSERATASTTTAIAADFLRRHEPGHPKTA
jgi:pimeloyl-ACP methyl ester carboxylesterase